MIKAIKPSYLTKKPLPLPRGLFYKYGKCDYALADSYSGNLVGTMSADATSFDPNFLYKKKDEDKIFHIYTLNILPQEQNKHWGQYFMNFAKQESFKQNCDGRISLVAYNPDAPPHLFYWKQGLRSKNNRMNRLLKKTAEGNIAPYFSDATAMYLPIKTEFKPIKKIPLKKTLHKVKKLLKFNR